MKSFVALACLVAVAAAAHHGHHGHHGHGGHGDMKDKIEWYIVESAEDDCSAVPEEVMKGEPMKKACMGLEPMAAVCMCVKKPKKMMMHMMEEMNEMMESGEGMEGGEDMTTGEPRSMMPMINEETGFMNMCGQCEDPCALKFKPDNKMLRKMGEGKKVKEMLKECLEMVPKSVKALIAVAMDLLGWGDDSKEDNKSGEWSMWN